MLMYSYLGHQMLMVREGNLAVNGCSVIGFGFLVVPSYNLTTRTMIYGVI
jgi:hypothetical protein